MGSEPQPNRYREHNYKARETRPEFRRKANSTLIASMALDRGSEDDPKDLGTYMEVEGYAVQQRKNDKVMPAAPTERGIFDISVIKLTLEHPNPASPQESELPVKATPELIATGFEGTLQEALDEGQQRIKDKEERIEREVAAFREEISMRDETFDQRVARVTEMLHGKDQVEEKKGQVSRKLRLAQNEWEDVIQAKKEQILHGYTIYNEDGEDIDLREAAEMAEDYALDRVTQITGVPVTNVSEIGETYYLSILSDPFEIVQKLREAMAEDPSIDLTDPIMTVMNYIEEFEEQERANEEASYDRDDPVEAGRTGGVHLGGDEPMTPRQDKDHHKRDGTSSGPGQGQMNLNPPTYRDNDRDR